MLGRGGDRIDLSARLEEWRRLLLDTSKRSRLISSKFGRGGILAIEPPDFYQLWEQLAVNNQPCEFPWPSQWIDIDQVDESETEDDDQHRSAKGILSATQLQTIKQSLALNSNSLLTNLTDRPLDGRLKRLALAASTSLSEQGVNSLFMAFGFLRRFESADSDVPILSPLVLMPVSLRKQSADASWALAAIDDDLASNHPLAELLRSEFRLNIPQFTEEALWESSESLKSFFAEVERAIAGHERWQVQLTAGLGTFGFQKISMWQDLRKNEDQITSHPLCRGIAGDSSLMPVTDASDILDSDLDMIVPPETSNLVRDCDSSQLAAMEVVQQGHHLIMDGPPGTGKSQTITNIIARCLANNKTVLFVSEKAAALEVVKRRLDEAKLGDFCLECHSHKANKRAVVEELGRCLNRETETYPSQDHKITELRRTRQKLNDYVRALHIKRSALNLTAYSVHGRLARIRTSSATRVIIAETHSIDRNRLQEMEEAVTRLASCGTIIAAKAIHPWRGCRTELYSLTLTDDIRFHFGRAAAGLEKHLDAARPLANLGFLGPSPTLNDVAVAAQSVSAVLLYPRIPPRWINGGLMRTAERYIALHEFSKDYRILCSSVPHYTSEAYVNANPFVAALIAAGFAKLQALFPALPTSVRQLADYLDGIDAQLQTMLDLTGKLESAIRLLREPLAVPNTLISTVGDTSNLAASILTISGLDRTKPRPEWFDTVVRKRLRQVADDANQIASMATATRLPLESKFLPSAFASIASEQIDDVLRHRSWFKRFGGSWRNARQSFCPLYTAQTPRKTREILDDAFQLKRFHQYVSSLKTTVDQDREALLWDTSINFDWDSLIGRLDAVELLPSDLQSGEAIRSITTSLDPTSWTKIVAAAQQVRELINQLSLATTQAIEALKNHETFRCANITELPLAILKERTRDIQKSCQEHAASLKAIFPFIENEHDVAVDCLVNDFNVLVEIRNLTHQAAEIALALGDTLPDPRSRSIGDWKDRADLAEWVITFLNQYAGAPPEHIVRGISDDAVRTELSTTVEKIKLTDDSALRNSMASVESLFSQTEQISNSIILNRATISELADWLAMRVRDADRITEWVSYTNACENLRRIGLQSLQDEILDGSVRADEAVNVLRQRFYRLWLDEAYRGEPVLAEFDLAQHDQTLGRFQEVDRFWVKNGFAQVRSRILANLSRVDSADGQAPENSELGILLREVHKRKRHLPLRRLFGSIPSLLLKLKPCVMMSPLAVSTYFGNSEIRFDVVIFDEASQVRPHDAICAIYRGSQLVVAGDQKQLPPTNFFERLGNEDEDEDEEELEHSSSDYESILDMCATLRLPKKTLKWHYRSKRESLIAFSNQHFYYGELVTFPSVQDVDGSSGVSFRFIENGRWSGRVNEAEAEQIADAVIRHAAEQPEKSLGVITMNQPQQMHVIELIENRRRASLHLEQFFSVDKPDPFFVKNLENVQGDERDVIFLGVGYAKNDAGTLNHSFYPLNRPGGERRLNVAITRAREAMTVFTSIRPDDIDLSRTQARGAKLLRAYLDFAERGKVALASTETEDSERDFDSDFEVEVARALADHGLDVHRQIGCSGFRIDLALAHPAHPGRYVLGIECDGATYHSSATVRDRDRLRQDILEGLGWKICRIWSTDWIRDPRRQIQKVLDSYERALNTADTKNPQPNEVELLEPVTNISQDSPKGSHVSPQFSAIEDVPQVYLRMILVDAITQFGTMPLEDLMLAAARKLGFQRTGSRIRDRVSLEVKNLERQRKLVAGSDGRLRLGDESETAS